MTGTRAYTQVKHLIGISNEDLNNWLMDQQLNGVNIINVECFRNLDSTYDYVVTLHITPLSNIEEVQENPVQVD